MSGSAPGTTVVPAKILVRGVNWLGDAVMTTPALQRLREARPADSITMLTSEKLAELWQGHPAIDRVISFCKADTVPGVARRLRAEHFDVCLILPNSFRSALEVFLARIPVRIGYARNARGFLLTQRIRPRPGERPMRKRSASEVRLLIRERTSSDTAATDSVLPNGGGPHHIYNYLHLAQTLGAVNEPLAPQVAVKPAEAERFVEKFGLAEHRKLGIPLFGLNPGAEYGPAKRWPPERFIAAAAEIQRLTGCCWLIFGGAGDVPVASAIASALSAESAKNRQPSKLSLVLNLAGKTTLRELCSGLSLCSVVLTNDSGPMHLAAAVGSRVVALFGSTSPQLTAPGIRGDPRHTIIRVDVPCSPCFRRTCPIDLRCLTRISEQDAINAVLRVAPRPGIQS